MSRDTDGGTREMGSGPVMACVSWWWMGGWGRGPVVMRESVVVGKGTVGCENCSDGERREKHSGKLWPNAYDFHK